MKHLIFDSGPLINFSMNGLLYLLEKLKKDFKGNFLITKEVKEEIIDYPLTIKKFELGALRLKKLYEDGIISHANINKKEVEELRVIRDNLIQIANTTFKTRNRYLHILDKGEAAALALSLLMKRRHGEEVPIVIDERTARMLSENPGNLRRIFEKKFSTSTYAESKNYDFFKNFKIIRSAEIAYIAYKKNFIELKDTRTLDAILYGLKYRGCSISEEEIEELKRLRLERL